MNTNWIYDLDFTLYQINSEQDFDYNLLNYNPNLNNNIKSLKGKKVLFTNGNLLHTMGILYKKNEIGKCIS